MRKIVTSFVLLLALLPAAAMAAQKIGYVNMQYLIDNSPQAQAASSRLQEEFGPKQQELQQKQQAFQQLQQKLQKDGLVMSDEERQDAQERLSEMKREIQRMQQAFREDVNIERNNLLTGVREAAVKAVRALAEEEGFDLVLGQGALHASDSVNLTQRVLDRMKEKYAGGSE